MRTLFVALMASILIVSPGFSQSRPVPTNIILLIGDGMGVSQVTAGRTYKGSLELDNFRHLGLVVTHAYGKDYVTDSAAGATALATGVTTYNGAIGVGPDSSQVETILERAMKKGKKTGLVAVCSITHATPASFAAHVYSRTQQIEIAEQLASCGADVLLGSGWGWFVPTAQGGRREDGRDLISDLKKSGYAVATRDEDFGILNASGRKILGLFAENHVGPAQERPVSLREMTETALASLSKSEKGFFLMVEGSQIDWASHDNNSDQVMIEMADFDDAVGAVRRFAERNPETLVVVTADHETGGYGLVGGSQEEKSVRGKFLTDSHTAAMVPLFAMGPGAERLTGIQSNADVGKKLLMLWD